MYKGYAVPGDDVAVADIANAVDAIKVGVAMLDDGIRCAAASPSYMPCTGPDPP